MVAKAFVNKDICIGCSVCSEICSSVFKLKQDPNYGNDIKSFTDDGVDQKPIADTVQQAIDSCPVQCISWQEKEEKKITINIKLNGE